MKSFYNVAVVTVSAFFVLWSATPSDGLHILGIFPSKDKNNFAMSERLMKGLAERGHRVDVYSHFPLENPPKNYTDFTLENILPEMRNNITYESFNDMLLSIKLYTRISQFGLPLCNLLKLPTLRNLVKKSPKYQPYDLVIVEPYVANCYLALGRHLKVPLVTVSTSNLMDWVHEPLRNPFNPAVHPAHFSSAAVPMDFCQRMENIVVSMVGALFFNFFVKDQDAVIKEIFGPGYPSAQELYKDVSLMLVNYNQALNGIRPFAPSVIPVGGLHIVDSNKTLTQQVQKFLDESKHGFIFMSFGSTFPIEKLSKTILEAFFAAFRKVAPVRILIKIYEPNELLMDIPPNVLTHYWLPYDKVLKHKNIKAFITDGGLMSTQEAIYYGVPMIGVPFFADQLFNIKSHEQKSVAIKLDVQDISEKTVSRALDEILNSQYKKKAVKMGKMLRDVPQNPMDTAAYWIEYVHRHGKNALRPAELDLSWWQIASLDVFAVLSITLVLAALSFIIMYWQLFILCRHVTRSIAMKLKRD